MEKFPKARGEVKARILTAAVDNVCTSSIV